MSVRHTENTRTRVVKIEYARTRTSDMISLAFFDSPCSSARPGQYIMVWIPGIDEIPMALSAVNEDGLSEITVRKVGTATGELHSKKEGDTIGIRGPLGRGYEPVRGRCLLVGGGTGIASLTPLAKELAMLGSWVDFVIGARNAQGLPFLDRLTTVLKNSGELIVTTDDGSSGQRGFASDAAVAILNDRSYDVVYTCGPEKMMVQVFEAADRKGIEVQASLERLIKCGIGLCGSCAIGGLRVCIDGPVFGSKHLRQLSEEFGKWKLNASGQRIAV